MLTFRHIAAIIIIGLSLNGCSSMLSSAKESMAHNLSVAITNSDDLETVKTGAPAYLLMLDSFIEGDPEDSGLLVAAAKLYGAYDGLFVKDEQRAKRMTQKALDYALQASCLQIPASCNLKTMPYDHFSKVVDQFNKEQIDLLFTVGASWASWIQNRSGNWNAAADLARVTYIMQHVLKLDETFEHGQVHLYLGILNTLLPPALGGKPELGQKHFLRAIELSQGKNLIAKVLYAEKYARLVFDQKLHDDLLNQVLQADPHIRGFTLSNMLAQQQAKALLLSGKDYF
jgi:uncharacterized protein YceK